MSQSHMSLLEASSKDRHSGVNSQVQRILNRFPDCPSLLLCSMSSENDFGDTNV